MIASPSAVVWSASCRAGGRQSTGLASQAAGDGVNAMSIDVEVSFPVWAFEGGTDRTRLRGMPSRFEFCFDRVCNQLATPRVSATFFVPGWIAESHAHWIRRVAAAH